MQETSEYERESRLRVYDQFLILLFYFSCYLTPALFFLSAILSIYMYTYICMYIVNHECVSYSFNVVIIYITMHLVHLEFFYIFFLFILFLFIFIPFSCAFTFYSYILYYYTKISMKMCI